MKIALVGPAYPHRGGIAQYNTALFGALRSRYPSLLISFSRLYPSFLFPGSNQEDVSAAPFVVPTERLIDSIAPRSWQRAASRLHDFNADLIVFQWWHPFFGPAYRSLIRGTRRLGGRPSVFFVCHNVMPHEMPRLPGIERMLKLAVKSTFAKVDGFLAHSSELAQQIRFYRPDARIMEIGHPIYDIYPSAALPDEIATTSRPARILFFGNIRPYKGLDTLLRALALLKGRMQFKATIAGEFYTDPAPYRRLADELNLAGELEWKDYYVANEEVPRLFQNADLVVLPYTHATQSGVIPLAYHFNVPVIASQVGGLREVIQDGVNGYLVPPADPGALAERIGDYFALSLQTTFQKAIGDVKQRLSWDRLVDNICRLFEESRAATRG